MPFTYYYNIYPLSFVFSKIDERLRFHIHNNNTHDTHLQAEEKYFTISYVKSISESFTSLTMKFHCKLGFYYS